MVRLDLALAFLRRVILGVLGQIAMRARFFDRRDDLDAVRSISDAFSSDLSC